MSGRAGRRTDGSPCSAACRRSSTAARTASRKSGSSSTSSCEKPGGGKTFGVVKTVCFRSWRMPVSLSSDFVALHPLRPSAGGSWPSPACVAPWRRGCRRARWRRGSGGGPPPGPRPGGRGWRRPVRENRWRHEAGQRGRRLSRPSVVGVFGGQHGASLMRSRMCGKPAAAPARIKSRRGVRSRPLSAVSASAPVHRWRRSARRADR